MKFKSTQERDDYLKYLIPAAARRFNALGLGSHHDIHPKTRVPAGVWADPQKAAMAGHKLILYGPSGCGKTSVLKYVAWLLALYDMNPRGGYVPRLLDRLKSKEISETKAWLNGDDLRVEGRDPEKDRNFLVLDDFDKIRGTAFEGETFLSLIDKYTSEGKSVIVTLNIRLDEFVRRITANGVPEDYAEAMLSRLNKNGHFIEMTARDFRKEV